jgi:zinc protease
MAVGDVDREAIIARIEQLFGDWKPGALPELNLPALPKRTERSVYVVDRPGSAQSNIVIANEGITRTSSDYFPMLLMHTILGANASSRLFMNLREEKGYTYGAYSNLDARRLAGTFRASAEVRTPVTGASLHEFFYELGRIRDEAVSADELKNAKSYLSGVFPIRIETQDGLIDQLVSIRMYDLPPDYLETYREQINAVTAEDIQRVAQTHVTPDQAAVVIVGDAAEINDQVKAYSDTIEVYDTDGKPKAVGSRQ